jgi:hypothetical protein
MNERLLNAGENVIYPNPANGRIYFKNIANTTFSIYDAKGMNVGMAWIDSNGQADISRLPAGFYFILVKDQDSIYKIIKE